MMKAMAYGAIPITSKLEHSVLFNLTGPFDLGPTVALSESIASDGRALKRWLDEQWVPAVISAVETAAEDTEKILSLRLQMMAFARVTFSWEASAAAMATLFT